MKSVLVLFSGNKDSSFFGKGFVTYLVIYEKGCGLNAKAAIFMGKRLIKSTLH